MDFHTINEAYKTAHSENMGVTSGMSIWITRDTDTMKITLSGFHSSSTVHNPADGSELLGEIKAWNVSDTEDFDQAAYEAKPEEYISDCAYYYAEQYAMKVGA